MCHMGLFFLNISVKNCFVCSHLQSACIMTSLSLVLQHSQISSSDIFHLWRLDLQFTTLCIILNSTASNLGSVVHILTNGKLL